jgi:tetratricopeptide (TPR) repeat protein
VAKSLSKELKQPDEFVSFWTQVGAKLNEHRRKLIVLLVVAAVAGAVGWGVAIHRASRAAQATVAFDRIDRIVNADLLPEKAPDTAKPEPSEDNPVPRFKTERERLEAANQEADAFVAKWGKGGLGRKALLGKASRLIALGKPGEAASIYQSLVESESDPELKVIEMDGVAAAREAEGKLDDALLAYTALADETQRTGSFYLDRALYGKARILEKQGKDKDAEKTLREILDKVPKTVLRTQIDDRLAVLTEK